MTGGSAKILVTGGGGFLGHRIVQRLRARGWMVRSLGRSPQPVLEALGVEVHIGDVADPAVAERAVAGCGAVFHAAALASASVDPGPFERINLGGTQSVLAACRKLGVQRLIHTSTPSVIFDPGGVRGADESIPYPSRHYSHYPRTKAEAERLVLKAGREGDLETVALRPHLLIGPGDPHLLPRLLERARKGRLRMVGDGRNRVDFTSVENAADAHLDAFDALERNRAVVSGRAYFITNGEPVELWPWVNALLEYLGEKPVRRRVPLGVAFVSGGILEVLWRLFRLRSEPPMTRFAALQLGRDHWFDLTAARRDLGYQPRQSLDEVTCSIVESFHDREKR